MTGFVLPSHICGRCGKQFYSRKNVWCPECRKLKKKMEDRWLKSL